MDIEKLIEQLRDKGCEDCPHRDTCRDDDTAECVIRLNAATALSTLQAENDQLRAELYSLRPGFQNQKALIKQLRAELEKIKRERDAAIKDIWVPKWISCKNGKNCSYISAITGMPDCAGCDNWKWRGQEEEN